MSYSTPQHTFYIIILYILLYYSEAVKCSVEQCVHAMLCVLSVPNPVKLLSSLLLVVLFSGAFFSFFRLSPFSVVPQNCVSMSLLHLAQHICTNIPHNGRFSDEKIPLPFDVLVSKQFHATHMRTFFACIYLNCNGVVHLHAII